MLDQKITIKLRTATIMCLTLLVCLKFCTLYTAGKVSTSSKVMPLLLNG